MSLYNPTIKVHLNLKLLVQKATHTTHTKNSTFLSKENPLNNSLFFVFNLQKGKQEC